MEQHAIQKCISENKRLHKNFNVLIGFLIQYTVLGENDKVILKQNHPFFYQVQGQNGVTGKNHCDFFVYTHFGIHRERITLSPEIWKNILQTLRQFWHKYLAPEILLQNLQTPTESIALHDQAQAQPDKSKIYTQKRRFCYFTCSRACNTKCSEKKILWVLKMILLHVFRILDNQNL